MSRHLFLVDPLSSLDPDHDTTYVIMRELEDRGRELWVCRSSDLTLHDGRLSARAARVSVHESGRHDHFRARGESRLSFGELDLVWMREDPPFDRQYLYATYLLEHAPCPVLNDPGGIRDSNEKLLILDFPEWIPPTWVGADPESARAFLEEVGGEGVLKTLEGFGGEQVFRLGLEDPNGSALLDTVTDGGETTVMVQQYLPAVHEAGDRRVLLLDGEPLGALTRRPAPGDFRANLHSGGSAADARGLEDRERGLCEAVAPELRRRGLHFVGLDLIDGRLTEINVTSPTCVQEINALTGDRLEEDIVDHALSLVEE